MLNRQYEHNLQGGELKACFQLAADRYWRWGHLVTVRQAVVTLETLLGVLWGCWPGMFLSAGYLRHEIVAKHRTET